MVIQCPGLLDPYLQALAEGVLKWAGENVVGPALLTVVSGFLGVNVVQRQRANDEADELSRRAGEATAREQFARPAVLARPVHLISDEIRLFAESVKTFHKNMATTLQSRSAPKLQADGARIL